MTSTDAARHAVGEFGDRDGFRDRHFARTGGTGGLRLLALVDALQMAAIGGDRTRALVVVRQRLGDGQLAAAAVAFGAFLTAGALAGDLAPPFLAALFFLFLDETARGVVLRHGPDGDGGGACRFVFLLEPARGFFFGVLAGQFVGGLAGIFFGLALFGGDRVRSCSCLFFDARACAASSSARLRASAS